MSSPQMTRMFGFSASCAAAAPASTSATAPAKAKRRAFVKFVMGFPQPFLWNGPPERSAWAWTRSCAQGSLARDRRLLQMNQSRQKPHPQKSRSARPGRLAVRAAGVVPVMGRRNRPLAPVRGGRDDLPCGRRARWHVRPRRRCARRQLSPSRRRAGHAFRAEPGFWIGEAALMAGEGRLVSLSAAVESTGLHLAAGSAARTSRAGSRLLAHALRAELQRPVGGPDASRGGPLAEPAGQTGKVAPAAGRC